MPARLEKSAVTRVRIALYLAPALLLSLLVFFYPICKTIYNSLHELVLGGANAGASRFVGLGNFRFVFKDPLFAESLGHNFLLFLVCVPLLVVLSVAVAVLLNQGMTGWRAYRTIVFIPYVLPIVVVGISFGFMFQLNGVINTAFAALKLDALRVDWLAKSNSAFLVLVVMIVWKELGFGVVIMLARLLSVDESLIEAGRLDGCNSWQLTLPVIVPQMKEIIYFYTVLATITVFTWLFNYVFVLTRGGPGTSTYILELYAYNQAFRYQNRGLSSAVAALIILAVLLVTFLPELRRLAARKEGIEHMRVPRG